MLPRTASRSNRHASSPVSNRFCDDWIQAFLNAAERCNPFLLRQILENFKLKVGQTHSYLSSNTLIRMLAVEIKMWALKCCELMLPLQVGLL